MEERAEQQGAPRAGSAGGAGGGAGGGEIRRLDRAPSERYETDLVADPPAGAGRSTRLARAVGAAAVSALIVFLLTGFDVGLGLLAVAAAAGWLVGLALAGSGQPVAAGVLAVAGVTMGLLADGLRALTQGGVLAPWAYAWERFGPLAIAVLVVAALAGAWRGR